MNSVITETLLNAWNLAPFPALLVYLFLLGAVWLYAEFQLTRIFRMTPGWRKAGPLLPQLSLAFAWLIRLSRGMLWLWLIFFLILFGVLLADKLVYNQQMPWTAALLSAASYWRTGYETAVGYLPEIVRRVLPGV
jgi:hypothetical protein